MSAKFRAAIARARRTAPMLSSTTSTPSKRARSSSSELSSPPASDSETSPPSSSTEPKTRRIASGRRSKVKLESPSPQKLSGKKPPPRIKVEDEDQSSGEIKNEIKVEPLPSMGDTTALSLPSPPPRKKTKPSKAKKAKRELSTTPPEHWEEMYDLTKQMRLSVAAPVDTMGCDVAADKEESPLIQRFQILVSLMLSSQTKDTVNALTMARLRKELPGGLNLQSILDVEPQKLNEMISAVGFHRRKTEYIKSAAKILKEKHGGDIPSTFESLVELPGVGPKMANLCVSAAWDKTVGIGVDVHVHRITNLWGWVESTTPEGTREQLQAWLPRDKWREVNWLLVGFGQTICLPRGRKCDQCLLSKGLCRAAFKGDAARRKAKVESESEEVDEEGESEEEYKPPTKGKSPRKRMNMKSSAKMKKEESVDIEDAGGIY